MDDVNACIAAKKAKLDVLRGAASDARSHVDHTVDLELTYSSNAIEGNTLTQIETNLVIEEGLTIGGKPSRTISKRSTISMRSVLFATSPRKKLPSASWTCARSMHSS